MFGDPFHKEDTNFLHQILPETPHPPGSLNQVQLLVASCSGLDSTYPAFCRVIIYLGGPMGRPARLISARTRISDTPPTYPYQPSRSPRGMLHAHQALTARRFQSTLGNNGSVIIVRRTIVNKPTWLLHACGHHRR
ncbi:hypothetical protein B0T16DRAFT_415758 [Cercophora newfieldiana]|uniref:Uncharacterized protein n=1 Tax=Cercophora newfieldiana TaxID=92897 RepID=A0AA39Y1X4_9PEZI|nr:hypothetical protein B0T16DRAFT_415758 [Cercophora newfieldiana]